MNRNGQIPQSRDAERAALRAEREAQDIARQRRIADARNAVRAHFPGDLTDLAACLVIWMRHEKPKTRITPDMIRERLHRAYPWLGEL